jgi:putative tryptophan/tyrosine transport system substrate-binding protein
MQRKDAVAAHARRPGGGLVTLPGTFSSTHRDAIIAAAAKYKLPTIGDTVFPRAGGLMSYHPVTADQGAQAASYIDRILRAGV